MRFIKLDGQDSDMFAHEPDDPDLDFYHGHKDTFKTMWADQGRNFWIRFVISFRWHIANHGVLSEFPGKKEDFDANVDKAFIYIHDNFVDGKVSQASGLLVDTFTLSLNRHTIKYLGAKTISKDPFYASATREVFRRLFGDPTDKKSYTNVYYTLLLYTRFGGAVIKCVRRWMEAKSMEEDRETYWEPPQNLDNSISPSKSGAKPKKKKAQAEEMNNSQDDDDYQVYLEEKLKGHRFGPLFVKKWSFGDPRFVDEENPLYNLKADSQSDWRDDITFIHFRKFYQYVNTTGRIMSNYDDFMSYNPELLVYPPPPNRRIYDEIERSFLERCEKNYQMGAKVPKPPGGLRVDAYNTKDRFFIGKWTSQKKWLPVENELSENPCPEVYPRLESGTKLRVVRKHIDRQGIYEKMLPGDAEDVWQLDQLCTDIFANLNIDDDSDDDEEDECQKLNDMKTLREVFKDDDGPKRRNKVAKKPSAEQKEQIKLKQGEGQPESDSEDEGAVGGVPPATKKAKGKPCDHDPADDLSDDDEWYFRRKIPAKGPDYPTCLEEMDIVPMSDIEPQIAGLMKLMCNGMGNSEMFDLARRKATLPLPDCKDEFSYGRVTGYRERQMIDSMAISIAKEARKAKRLRKRAHSGKSGTAGKKDKKPTASAAGTKKEQPPQEALKRCTVCRKVEPEPRTYKKCQRCKVEKVINGRYYCGRDCQAIDWKEKHRKEHNQHLMECEPE